MTLGEGVTAPWSWTSIHPMKFDDINELLRRIREQARAKPARR